MEIVSTALKAAGLSEAVVKKADRFLASLLGGAVRETGELITDKIRYRRFRNQVAILQRAERFLEGKGLSPSLVSLKVLVPLLEKSSLEEDQGVQEMWASLLANAALSNAKSRLHSICIEVLNGISPLEAKLLRGMLEDFESRKPRAKQGTLRAKDLQSDSVLLRPHTLFRRAQISKDDGYFLLENLMRFNLIRYATPRGGEKLVATDFVQFTSLGVRVLRECTSISEGER